MNHTKEIITRYKREKRAEKTTEAVKHLGEVLVVIIGAIAFYILIVLLSV